MLGNLSVIDGVYEGNSHCKLRDISEGHGIPRLIDKIESVLDNSNIDFEKELKLRIAILKLANRIKNSPQKLSWVS